MLRHIIVIMEPAGSSAQGVLHGISRYLRIHRRWVIHLAPDWQRDPGKLGQHRPHGMIVRTPSLRVVRAIARSGVPAVDVGECLAEWPLPSVQSDNEAVGQLGAEHLLQCGLKRFAFVGLTGLAYSQQRQTGFARALAKAGIECDAVRLNPASGSNRWYMPLVKWLKRPESPLGIMACNDSLAREVYVWCRRKGIRVPEEVALLGVDNDGILCNLLEVPLSSVAPDFERIGFEAAGMLDGLMTGKPPPAEPCRIAPIRVVARQSTDMLAVEDPEVASALRLIRARAYDAEATVERVAREVSIARRALDRRFRLAVGRSLHGELLRVRLERAKELLAGTDLPRIDVARLSGFGSAQYFTAAFRRQIGLMPSEYRRRHGPPPANGH